ncbi:MAG: hypothetical protein AAGD00_02330 [Planctomycetota bacterium]
MPTTLKLHTPSDYVFARDVCSYGYFLLAPNRWDPKTRSLTRPLRLRSGERTTVRLDQLGDAPGEQLRVRAVKGRDVRARCDRALTPNERTEVKRLLRRMLSLDDDGVRAFHRIDWRWKKSGRGRLFRSPTVFEDVIKTVTSCNVAWTSTIRMNERLCEVVEEAFPSPRQLARRRPETLRARCGVGYRDKRIVELARRFAHAEIDPARLEDPGVPDDVVEKELLGLPGVGPYAAGNIMQLLGRFSRLAIDTETVRHARAVLGMEGESREIEKRVAKHYEPFGEHKFRSYWFELWDFYEAARGPAWTWDPRTTGKTFTASQLK